MTQGKTASARHAFWALSAGLVLSYSSESVVVAWAGRQT
jgi:hypothetical protein